MSDDYIRLILDSFCDLTGRMSASPLDYSHCQGWQGAGIPLPIVQRGIQDKIARAKGKRWLRTMPLSWCEADVAEGFASWKRAIGPRWRDAL